jgi:hypothetical protein
MIRSVDQGCHFVVMPGLSWPALTGWEVFVPPNLRLKTHVDLPYIVQGGQEGQPPSHSIIDVMQSASAGQAMPHSGLGQQRFEAGADIR